MPGITDLLSDFLGSNNQPVGNIPIAGKQSWDNRSFVFPPNYAVKIRALDADVRSALVIPRRPFTFIADFIYGDHVNASLLSANTRQVTANIKTVEKPGFTFDVETLSAYNTPRPLIKRVMSKDITITFYDDATSFITGMLRAYRSHYAYSGLVTGAAEVTEQRSASTGSYWQTQLQTAKSALPAVNNGPLNLRETGGASATAPTPASDGMPSYGLRPFEVPFFEAIKIYDLGSEPTSVNVYTLINPVIKEINMPTLDYSDGQGQQEITVTFTAVGAVTEVSVPVGDERVNGKDILKKHFDANTEFLAAGTSGLTFEGNGAQGLTGVLERIQDPRQRTLIGNLLRAVQSSVEGGELNWQDLRRNVFETVAAGTPIQNIRQAVTNIREIQQAVQQGRILDAASLLGDLDVLREGIPGLNSNSSIGSVITRMGEETRNIIEGVENELLDFGGEASSWLSRHTNPLPNTVRGSSLPSKDLLDDGGP